MTSVITVLVQILSKKLLKANHNGKSFVFDEDLTGSNIVKETFESKSQLRSICGKPR